MSDQLAAEPDAVAAPAFNVATVSATAAVVERLRRAYLDLSFAEVVDAGLAACQAAVKAGDLAAHSDIAFWLAKCAKRVERWDEALQHANSALQSARRIGDLRRECLARAEVTIVTVNLGQMQEALSQAYELLALVASVNDDTVQACCIFAAARAHMSMQQWPQAEQLLRKGLACTERCGDEAGQANFHAALGAIVADSAEDAEQLRLAREHLIAGWQLYKKVGDRYGERLARLNHVVLLEKELGDCATVRSSYRSIVEEAGDKRDANWIIAMADLGNLELRAGEVELGLARMRDALSTAEAGKQSRLARNCALKLSEALESIGGFSEALKYYQRFHRWYAQLASEATQIHARAISIKFETELAFAAADNERQRAERLQVSVDLLAEQSKTLSKAAREDALTGLPNRRRFDAEMHALARQTDADYRLAMLDIDHFKRINDGFSHLVGDEVLRRVGQVLLRCCRPVDLIARYGGEEFVLVAHAVSREAMRCICERLREEIAAEDWSSFHAGLSVTVSIGTAGLDELDSRGCSADLVALADRRLYAAKHSGRNRVVDSD